MADVDLRDLTLFAALARHGSFRRAALQAGISVSSLSQRLRDFEARLGVRLVNRTTRSVALTEAGELLLARIAPALQEVTDALGTVQGLGATAAGRLRINAPAPAIQLVLAPMVTAFLRRYPAIELEIVSETALIDIVAAGFDAGVRWEEHLAQDMVALSLGPPERYVVVAAPALVAGHGKPAEPRDLLARPCIGTVFPSRARLPWEFERDGEEVTILPDGPLKATDPALLLRAAIEGIGFLMTFEGYARDAIADGRLVTVLDEWCPGFPGPFLYYPSRRQPPPALAAFVGFVKEWRARAA
jgi:DNA-binding transcriptional LysR family regulator